MFSCVHTHTTFCDGKHTPAEMAEAAHALHIHTLGFSAHSLVQREGFGLSPAQQPLYVAEIHRLKSLYEGKMEILCGMELDAEAPAELDRTLLDYTIGSCHSVQGAGGVFYTVDASADLLRENVRTGFADDFRRFAEAYYTQFVDYLTHSRPDFIGHFDLLSKFNENGAFFDRDARWYRTLACDALDCALQLNLPFEVNTGAIARGYRTTPYPDTFLLRRIFEKGGRVLITTDCHDKHFLICHEPETRALLQAVGFRTLSQLTARGFVEQPLE